MMDYGEYNTAFDLALYHAYRAAVGLAQPERVQPEGDPLPEAQRSAKRNHNKKPGSPPRLFRSKYVGVVEHRDRWMSAWGPTPSQRSGVFPHTDEGEEQAAWARARALGRDWLEIRPPEQVRGTPEATAALEAHGRGTRKLAGRRIG
jgi:hypothetical protein